MAQVEEVKCLVVGGCSSCFENTGPIAFGGGLPTLLSPGIHSLTVPYPANVMHGPPLIP